MEISKCASEAKLLTLKFFNIFVAQKQRKYLREQQLSLREIPILHLLLRFLPQRQGFQALLGMVGIQNWSSAQTHKDLRCSCRRSAVAHQDAFRQSHKVGAGAAAAQAAAGLDSDVGRSDAGEGFEGLE